MGGFIYTIPGPGDRSRVASVPIVTRTLRGEDETLVRSLSATIANPTPQRGAPRCKRWHQLSPGGKPGHEAHDALGYPRVPSV
jgi:hypothetical protein